MGYLYDLWDDFISLLYPRLCQACGNELLRSEKFICTECYVLIPRTGYHLVEDNPVATLFWGRCRIEKAAAYSFYNRDSRMRKLIHNFKYRGIKDIGLEMGRIYGLSLKDTSFLSGIDIIIPVPLHPSKKKIRGFNQSEIIAAGISEITGIPSDPLIIERKNLSGTQTKRSRYERWVNVEGIFTVTRPEKAAGKHLLLIDDVITTGSTMESCANELLKIDGVRVSVAALAVALV